MDVGVALSLHQGLTEDVVARVVSAHVELGVKDESVDEAEGEREERRDFKSLHGANLGNWLVGEVGKVGEVGEVGKVGEVGSLAFGALDYACWTVQ